MSDFYDYDRDAALDQIMEWEEEREMEKYYAQQWEEYVASCETNSSGDSVAYRVSSEEARLLRSSKSPLPEDADMQQQNATTIVQDATALVSDSSGVLGIQPSYQTVEGLRPSDQEDLKSPENLAVDDFDTLETDA